MLWSILIPSCRPEGLKRLVASLSHQVGPSTEIVALHNRGERSLGELRDALVKDARGEYVCFVDDDDTVSADYCNRIRPVLDGTVDYIGFKVAMTVDGLRQRGVVHSLEYRGWSQDENGFYRDISHLNPIRRELALQGSFAVPHTGAGGEDQSWSDQLRSLDVVKTQHFINWPMYFYNFYYDTSTWHRPVQGYDRPDISHPNFRWHEWSS